MEPRGTGGVAGRVIIIISQVHMPLFYAKLGKNTFAKFKKTSLHKQFRAKKIRFKCDEGQKCAESSPGTQATACPPDRGA